MQHLARPVEGVDVPPPPLRVSDARLATGPKSKDSKHALQARVSSIEASVLKLAPLIPRVRELEQKVVELSAQVEYLQHCVSQND